MYYRLSLIQTRPPASLGEHFNDNQSLIRDVIAYANETHTPLALISIDQMKAFDRR